MTRPTLFALVLLSSSLALADGADPGSPPLAPRAASATAAALPAGQPPPGVPADVETHAAARAYRETGQTPPILEHPSDIVFPYGHSQPVLHCAPLRVSAIELQDGEVVLNTARGDADRFDVAASFAGSNGKTPLLVVKPLGCAAATTNLLIATDRRIYDVTLDSPGCPKGEAADEPAGRNPRGPYTRLLRFYFPDELVSTLTSQEDLARRRAADEARNVLPLASSVPLTALNFNYRWDREARLPFPVPDSIFDDGTHVYIHFPSAARAHETPLLFVLRDAAATEVLNYAIRGDFYVTDRTFAHAALVAGAKKHAPRLSIDNQAPGAR
jgi:type IV secretory pathway VirB9-like protein